MTTTAAPDDVLDIPFTAEYCDDLHPARLYLAALLNGGSPSFEPGRPSYCELGCGNGLTLNLLAAALPEGRFVGVDLNPTHIARARRLAEQAGLHNIRFVEASFTGADSVETEDFDVIVAHWVYSWIDADSRAALETFVGNRLRTGGLFYLSYNAQPRWSSAEPIRKLLNELMMQRRDPSDVALRRSLETFDALADGRAGWFAESQRQIDELVGKRWRGRPQWWLDSVHEYGGLHWAAWYHCDVRRHLEADLGLSYVSTTDYARAWADSGGTRALEGDLATVDEPALRETLRDYVVQPLLRQEIYVRGTAPLTSVDRQREIDEVRVALLADPDRVSPEVQLPLGPVRLDETRLNVLLEHLRTIGADSVGNLIRAMEGEASSDHNTSRRLIMLLCRERVLAPIPALDFVADEARVRDFNLAASCWAQESAPFEAFLACDYGVGFPVGSLAQLIWRALREDVPAESELITRYLSEDMGLRIQSRSAERSNAESDCRLQSAVERALEGELPRVIRLAGYPSLANAE